MDWTELSIMTTSEAVEAVANILMAYGATGVSIEDAKDFEKLKPGRYGDHGEIVDPKDLTHIRQGAIVSAYYPNNQHIDDQADQIATRVRGLAKFDLNPGPAEVHLTPVVNQDWQTAWEKYYHPVSISRFITIVPSWEDYQPKSTQEKIVRLDPGMAFGTGTHPTTRLSLQALEMVMQGGESILDVGTGSGVLSIAAKLMGAGKSTRTMLTTSLLNLQKRTFNSIQVLKESALRQTICWPESILKLISWLPTFWPKLSCRWFPKHGIISFLVAFSSHPGLSRTNLKPLKMR